MRGSDRDTMETLVEQIRAREDFIPRLTTPELVDQMRREIVELRRRRDRRGD